MSILTDKEEIRNRSNLHLNGDVRYNFILKKRYKIYLVYYSRSKALKINVKSSDMYFEKELIRNWLSNELNFN